MKQNNYYQKGVLILLSFIATSLAIKAQTYTQDGIEYTLVGEEYSVTGHNASANTDLVIPATINDGKKVTSIGVSAFDGWKALQSVSLPVSIKSIGNYAFRGCTGLTEVHIPEGVTILDRWSFANCSNLKTIGLPSTLKTMNGNVFYNCIGLEKITLPADLTSIGNSVFSGCTGLKEITFMGDCPEVASGTFFSVGTAEEPTKIMVKDSFLTNYMAQMSGDGSSYQWASGGVLTLMSEIDGIIYAYVAGTTAHFSAAGMGTVPALADGTYSLNILEKVAGLDVTEITDKAFSTEINEKCSDIGNISFPASLNAIGNDAFYGCLKLNYLDFTKTSIGGLSASRDSGAFKGVLKQVMVYLPTGNTMAANQTNFCIGGQSDSITIYNPYGDGTNVAMNTASEINSGRAAYLLNKALNKTIFGQKIGTDKVPVPITDEATQHVIQATFTNAKVSVFRYTNIGFCVTLPEPSDFGLTSDHISCFVAGTTNKLTAETILTEDIILDVYPTITRISLPTNKKEVTVNLASGSPYVQLTYTTTPEDALQNVVWSTTDAKLATVSQNGYVTVHDGGNVKIVVTSMDDQEIADTCFIKATARVSAVKLDTTELAFSLSQETLSYRLKATVLPSDASQVVKWTTSDSLVAKVNNSGLVKAVGVGTADITAASVLNTKIYATCHVKVYPEERGIEISKKSLQLFLSGNNTAQLSASVTPAEAMQEVRWSSTNNKVVTVDDTGFVTAHQAGQAKILVTSVDNDIFSTECLVTVYDVTEKVVLNEAEIRLSPVGTNKTFQLVAKALPETAWQEFEWKSNAEAIAIVDKNGMVTALKEGDAEITATSKDNPLCIATCRVHITNIGHIVTLEGITYMVKEYDEGQNAVEITSISRSLTEGGGSVVIPSEITIEGYKYPIKSLASNVLDRVVGNTIVYLPAGLDYGKNVQNVVKCDETGKRTCSKLVLETEGRFNAVYGFTAENVQYKCGEMYVNQSTTICMPFSLISKEVNLQTYELKRVDDGIPVFSEVETTTAYQPYVAFITKYFNILVASNVEIVATPIEMPSVTVNDYTFKGTNTLIETEEAETMGAIVLDAERKWNAVKTSNSTCNILPFQAYLVTKSDKVTDWGIVNADGLYKQIIDGKVDAAGIKLNKTQLSFSLNKSTLTYKLVATIEPADALQEVKWTSTDSKIVEVNETGLVKAISAGEAYVTATSIAYPKLYANCHIVVHPKPEGIVLSENTLDIFLSKNQNAQLQAYVMPAAAVQDVKWASSNNNIATVNDKGQIFAHNSGQAKIYATSVDNETYTAECTIHVYEKTDTIILNQSEVSLSTLGENNTIQLTANAQPSTAWQNFIWKSSKEDVATVNQDGLVNAVSEGETIIYVISSDDSVSVATCKITVTNIGISKTIDGVCYVVTNTSEGQNIMKVLSVSEERLTSGGSIEILSNVIIKEQSFAINSIEPNAFENLGNNTLIYVPRDIKYTGPNNNIVYTDYAGNRFCINLILNNRGEFKAKYDFLATSVSYSPSKHNLDMPFTMCLPFSFKCESYPIRVYQFQNVRDGKPLFMEIADVNAYEPYMGMSNESEIIFNDVMVTATPKELPSSKNWGFTLKGNMGFVNPETASDMNVFIFDKNGVWHKAIPFSSVDYIEPFQTYFIVNRNDEIVFEMINADGTLGISNVTDDKQKEYRYYDMNGRFVGNSLVNKPSGIYIRKSSSGTSEKITKR